MLFSTAEIEACLLLRLCGLIQIKAVHAAFTGDTVSWLQRFGFITVYKKHDAYILTQKGVRFLDEHFDRLPAYIKPTYRETYITRRLRIASLVLTCYRAGLSVFQTDISSLERSGSFYLTSQSRIKGMNPWGSTRVAALLRIGDIVCGAHYVEKEIGRVSLPDEMNAFNNCTSQLGNQQRAWIFTGETYDSIITALSETRKGRQYKQMTYGDVFRKIRIPVFLTPSNETGARQLRLMLEPDYRTRMTRLALGSYYEPPPKEHPEWDAMYKGAPFVMAADMDIKRFDAAAQAAKSSGHEPMYMVALKGQEDVLRKRYKVHGLAQKIFTYSREKPEVINALTLYTPSDRQYETTKGEVIHAPPFQADRKAGRPARQ